MRLGRGADQAAKQGRWYVRVVRGRRPDRNPLRRTSDRVETYLLTGLFVATTGAAPFAVMAASHAAYTKAERTEQAEVATRHQVRAVLKQAAGSAADGYELSSYVPVLATWTSRTGAKHTAEVMAPTGSQKGSTVTVWTDAAGNLTSPPLLASQVAGQADLAALGAIAGIGLLYVCETAIVRRVLYHRRMAAWAADWEVTARTWNRQRW